MMPLPEIKGFLETSFLDWPGKLASVVFLPGCNFRCPYCHNHRLVLTPDALGTWPLEAVLERMDALRGWVDGICVTGGEPTLHEQLPRLLEAFRFRQWAVKLDTNGSRPDVLRRLMEQDLLDAVALDVKAPLEPIPYRRNTGSGGDPEAVRQSLALLAASDLPVEVRTTVHADLLSFHELLRLSRQVPEILARGEEQSAVRFTLQRCRVDDPLDPDLRARPNLEPATFDSWSRSAREAFDLELGPRASQGNVR